MAKVEPADAKLDNADDLEMRHRFCGTYDQQSLAQYASGARGPDG